MINVQQVSKQFNRLPVLRNLNLTISEGEVIGLLGPNGAGKTTTLRMLSGVLPPSSGKITINGQDPIEEVSVRQEIGYLPEDNPLYDDMTVEEWLGYWQKIKTGTETSAVKEVVHKTGLGPVYYRVISELSKGFRQRVGLAQAMLGNPKILLLDEPSEGLDPNQRREIQDLIKDLGKKKTVIISSHVLGEITKMCNRLVILHQGQIAADGTPEEITAASGGQALIVAGLIGKGIVTGLKKFPGVTDVKQTDKDIYQINVEHSQDIRMEIFELAKKNKWQLFELTKKEIELEEVFTKLTR